VLVFILLFQYFSFSQSLEDKVGQLFIVGIHGKQLTPTSLKQLNTIKPGGIILFRHNLSTPYGTYKFNSSLNDWAEKNALLPLLIGTDQEGGVVSRIKTIPRAPSAAILGRQQNMSRIENYATAVGQLMRAYGFNLNFAPVLDQTTSSYSDFIGTRAFSYDLDRIVNSSSAFATGIKRQGILTVGKHFPGHGNVLVDSHVGLPEVNLTKQQISSSSAIPFIELYKKDLLDAVMVGHLSFPKIDPRKIPATFSKPILNDFLRNDLSYQGLIITDDIEMKAAGISEDPAERAILALEAGADMIMVAWNPKSQIAAFEGIVNAVKSGRVTMERIHESLNRIQTAKTYLKPFPKWNDVTSFTQGLQNIPWARAVAGVESQSIDLLSLRAKLKSLDKNQLLVASADKRFLQKYPSAQKIWIEAATSIESVEQLLVDGGVLLFHSTSPKTVDLLSSLSPKLRSQVVVINSSRPEIKDSGYLFVANLLERSLRAERLVQRELQTRNPASAY
jgi:beta-N-acetylhexosaminidase